MERKLAILVIIAFFPVFLSTAGIIFTYDRCLQPLDKCCFYGSVAAVSETDKSFKLYISPGPDDVFIVYIHKKYLMETQFDSLFSNPVFISSRLWNNYYEVYTPEGIRYLRN